MSKRTDAVKSQAKSKLTHGERDQNHIPNVYDVRSTRDFLIEQSHHRCTILVDTCRDRLASLLPHSLEKTPDAMQTMIALRFKEYPTLELATKAQKLLRDQLEWFIDGKAKQVQS